MPVTNAVYLLLVNRLYQLLKECFSKTNLSVLLHLNIKRSIQTISVSILITLHDQNYLLKLCIQLNECSRVRVEVKKNLVYLR
ncbi:uncharacterized protein Smp_204250 [Schistosoma mansoni]|uniref:Secreted protein n=1 Tax=Schistosoma mansoni TaxID=6183 RepID=G4VS15_SCHMA|nr:uncharacterized protein Smp_204250 [Schistosoma mansoni]|eukprot:XP_018655367.1 uncharacterized protein Smp_204250 [Schistosoma mansoni]